MLINEIMHGNTVQCTEDTALPEVYEMLQSSPARFIVVVDSKQHRVPIGIVSEHSICESLVRSRRATTRLDAGDVMSSFIARVTEYATVDECGRLLSERLDAILVTDERRRFKGVVEQEDLRVAFAGSQQRPAPAIISGMITR